MEWIIKYLNEKYGDLIGWFEIVMRKESIYKCLIDSIEMQPRHTVINYKTIGCRSLQQETASNLNQSSVFSLFRPDHAQIIVSIATAESLLGKPPEEVAEKFQKYVSYCSYKVSKKQ